MKKLITAVFAIIILGAGMGLGTDTVAAKSVAAPTAANMTFDIAPDATSLPGNVNTSPMKNLHFKVIDTTDDGILDFAGNGKFTYTPNASNHGGDTFYYVACLSNKCSAPAKATIRVLRNLSIGIDRLDEFSVWANPIMNDDRSIQFDGPWKDVLDADDLIGDITFKVNTDTAIVHDWVVGAGDMYSMYFAPGVGIAIDRDSGIAGLRYHVLFDGENSRIQFFTNSLPSSTGDLGTSTYSISDGTHNIYGVITVSYNPTI